MCGYGLHTKIAILIIISIHGLGYRHVFAMHEESVQTCVLILSTSLVCMYVVFHVYPILLIYMLLTWACVGVVSIESPAPMVP